jgi:hypothetical protein
MNMNIHPATRTANELETVIKQMEFLVEHPRIQQRNWVANGRNWLPILRTARIDLVSSTTAHDHAVDSLQAIVDVFEKLGLRIRKRDATSWGFSWHDEPLQGGFPTYAQAVEAALRDHLKP